MKATAAGIAAAAVHVNKQAASSTAEPALPPSAPTKEGVANPVHTVYRKHSSHQGVWPRGEPRQCQDGHTHRRQAGARDQAQDIHDIRSYRSELMAEFWPDKKHPAPKIIAKIESTEGLKNFEEILKVTDSIMVARGDLGVEIPVEEVTNMQKMMVRRCKLVGKPVIVATQMLESMQVHPRPTRAEVSDVTHAVYDGADAVMLSGESAQGKYPVESVATMAIIEAAEQRQSHNAKILGSNLFQVICDSQNKGGEDPSHFYEASASSAVMAANRLQAKCIVVHTESGDMAKTVSKYCPSVPILVFTNNQKVARQLILHRGVHPIVIPEGHSWSASRDSVLEYVKKLDFCKSGDLVVVVTGETPSKDADMSLGTYFLRIAA